MVAILIINLSGCDSTQNQNTPTPTEHEVQAPPPLGWEKDKGIGPVKTVVLDSIVDQSMAAEGAQLYREKCISCHKPDKRYIGPAQKGILERRTPEWVMNMILNPEEMVKVNPIAKQLSKEFNTSPMPNQYLSENDARKILEYFRTL